MFNATTIMKCSREFAGDDLLVKTFEALDQVPTVETVKQLYRFIVEAFGRDDSSQVAKRFWRPVAFYLANNGVSKTELSQIRRPYPIYGEPGFRSILDEMYEEGHDVPEHLLSPTTKRRNQLVEN
jgi:hypothetical protein